jgi:RND family efflux transporter MFP subunit
MLLAAMGIAPSAEAREFDCTFRPSSVIRVGAPVEGLVVKSLVNRGDAVSEGQLLAQIDSAVQARELEVAEARAADQQNVAIIRRRLEFLRRQQERAAALRSRDVNAQVNYDSASTDADVSDAALKEAEINVGVARLEALRAKAVLEQRSVRSPIGGVVLDTPMPAGQFFFKKSSLMTLAALDPMLVEVALPVEALGTIKPGDKLDVRPQAPGGGSLTATVRSVDRVLDAQGRLGLQLTVPNPDLKIPSGLSCKAVVDIPDAAQ